MKSNSVTIKICGIKELETAKKAIALGANLIGLVLYEKSRRFLSINEAQKIAFAVKEAGAIPVVVVVDKTAKEISTICKTLNIDHVQLYGHAKAECVNLNDHIHRIYVKQVDVKGKALFENDKKIKLDQDRDYILYDGIQPGSGEGYLYQNLKLHSQFRCFIAGGLNGQNINSILENCEPYGVDVSSGVENKNGEKDIDLITHFIQTARQYYE